MIEIFATIFILLKFTRYFSRIFQSFINFDTNIYLFINIYIINNYLKIVYTMYLRSDFQYAKNVLK